MLNDLVRKNRSYRRFWQDAGIEPVHLKDLVDLARCCASAANRQPLKYILSSNPEMNGAIFACLGWAAYLSDWPGPPEGERPAAYITILGDTTISSDFWCDHGIAAQTILLGAVELGLGGCMLGSINKKKLAAVLRVPNRLEILLVIALGKPKENVRLECLSPDGDIRYFRDANGVHHVPKRSLSEVIIADYT